MTEQKTCKLDIPVTPSTKAELKAIAQRNDVSLAHVVRKAVREMLKQKAPHCPECKSTEVKENEFTGRGISPRHRELHCADCGTDWEVN